MKHFLTKNTIMDNTEENFIMALQEGEKAGMILIGNSLVGYRFTGDYERVKFWNDLLKELAPVPFTITPNQLKEKGISLLDYNPIWW